MFGNKDEKQKRLEQLTALVAQSQGINQAALARALGVTRSTINKDLIALEQRGVRLSQDYRGRLFPSD